VSLQRIKSLNVLCSCRLQVEAELQSTFLSFQPTSIQQQLIGAPSVTNVTILPQCGKVVLQGIVPVQATIDVPSGATEADINIPFWAVAECFGVNHDAQVQIHDIEAALVDPFVFRSIAIPSSEFDEFQIRFRAIVRLCVVISQEEVLQIVAQPQVCIG